MKRKQTIVAVAMAVLSVAVILVGGIQYWNNLQRSLYDQSVESVLEVTSQGTHSFEVFIAKNTDTVKFVSANLKDYDPTDEDAIINILSLLMNTGKYYAVVDLNRNIYYTSSENQILQMSEAQIELYHSLSDTGALEPYINQYNGQPTMGFYECFKFADGTPGLIQKGMLISDISQEFSLSFYNNTGFSYIVNKEGKILLRSDHENSNQTAEDIFDVIDEEGNSQENIDTFRAALENGEKGAAVLTYNKEDYVFAYVPVSVTDDGWYVISIVPSTSIMEHADQILRSSSTFAGVIGIVLFVFIVFMMLIYQSSRNIRKKELEIRYREQLFDILANNTDDVFLMFTPDQKVEYISPNVERVLGVPEDMIRNDIKALQVTEYNAPSVVPGDILKNLEPGGSHFYETERIHRTTGEHRWFLETIYRTTIDDTEKFITTISDRTTERQSKKALEDALNIAKVANESKSTFLSNMSHDIRTPMNAIVGLCTLLQRDADNPERVRDHTRKIASSSQHLLGLINDVLDMSKIESGKTTLNVSDIYLADLVREIETIVRPQIQAKEQEFEISVTDVKTEHLLGDVLRIKQVLINILSNAVKYTPAGGRINLKIRQMPRSTKNYAHFRFTVSDNGIGMAPEYLETIFEPFTREISSTTNKVQGTGLGMAITKNLVDLMGGTIRVKSELHKGTTFTVDLELRMQEQDIDPGFWKKYGVTQTLIVDDEIEVCSSIIGAMAGTGVAMQFATDGYTAIEMVGNAHDEGRDFDLILLDWKMPDLDGIETARRIRAIIPGDIPIMILTAYDWSEIEEEAKSAGIDGFLAKPFFITNFKQTLLQIKTDNEELIAEEAKNSAFAGLKFLAAEDNDLNAEILVEILSMVGATCHVEVNGEKVAEAFANSKPGEYDMILMDIQMPVMNGYDATKAIRSCDHPLAQSIPIIAMTANAFVEDVQAAKAAGMNAHVAKPIDLGRLESVIKDVQKHGTSFVI